MKNKTLNIVFSAIGTRGEGIAKTADCAYFVPFCLSGEEAEVEIVRQKNGVAEGRAVRLVKTVNGRTKPKCGVFGKCGGCQLQHMSYQMQLDYKQNLVKNNLKKLGGVDFDVLPTVQSAKQYCYRNKLQIPFAKLGGRTVSGFYKNGSHSIVPTDSCPLQDGWADDLCRIVREFIDQNDISVYDERTKTGLVRHLVARYIDGQLLATIVVNGDSLPCLPKLQESLDKRFDRYGLFLNINKTRTNVILGKITTKLCGIDGIEGECMGVKYNLQPNSFFQVNDNIRQKIYEGAVSLLDVDGCDIVIDAFSGVGILSAVLAKSGKPVYGIEIVREAVDDADKLKKINGLDNMTNICADVNIKLKQLCSQNKDKKIALVLDPPRKGLDTMTKNAVLEAKPQSIVYISCNSATLARDIHDLSPLYRLAYCRPYDMFPQTSNVETLAQLTLK